MKPRRDMPFLPKYSTCPSHYFVRKSFCLWSNTTSTWSVFVFNYYFIFVMALNCTSSLNRCDMNQINTSWMNGNDWIMDWISCLESSAFTENSNTHSLNTVNDSEINKLKHLLHFWHTVLQWSWLHCPSAAYVEQWNMSQECSCKRLNE